MTPTAAQVRQALENTRRAPRNKAPEAERAMRQRPRPAEREALERRLRGAP